MRLLLSLGLLRISAYACTCGVSIMPPLPCQIAWHHHAVFTGVVTDIVDPGFPTVERGEAPPSAIGFRKKQVTLKLSEAFTGLASDVKEVTIDTGLGGGDCGYPFQRGVEYIVYAYRRPNGPLETGICSPTRPATQASEDLKYLRGLPTAAVPGDIRVTALVRDEGRIRASGGWDLVGLAGVRVSLMGNNVSATSVTDSDGRSAFRALQPGEYNINAAAEGYRLSSPPVLPIKLHPKGCADVPLWLQLDRSVTGRVVATDGSPVAGVRVEAVRARPRQENERPYAVDTSRTDANGRYELKNLQAGDYYLGTTLSSPPTKENPYTRWFYPGTEDPRAAVLIHVSDTPERQTFDLSLPDPQKPRVIEGKVIWPDGSPALNAPISLQDFRWRWQAARLRATTDNDGHFEVEGLEGTGYHVNAAAFVGGIIHSAEPVSVEPGSGPARVRLVLSRKGKMPFEAVDEALEQWRQGRGLP